VPRSPAGGRVVLCAVSGVGARPTTRGDVDPGIKYLKYDDDDEPDALEENSDAGIGAEISASASEPQISEPSSASELSSSVSGSSSSSYLRYLMPGLTSPSKPSLPFSRTMTRLHILRTDWAAWLT
jgi:hypothetical protein